MSTLHMLGRIPDDFPVHPVIPSLHHPDYNSLTVCGTCGLGWDDNIPTSMTPAPSGRCPFEAFHDAEPEPEWAVDPRDRDTAMGTAYAWLDSPDPALRQAGRMIRGLLLDVAVLEARLDEARRKATY